MDDILDDLMNAGLISSEDESGSDSDSSSENRFAKYNESLSLFDNLLDVHQKGVSCDSPKLLIFAKLDVALKTKYIEEGDLIELGSPEFLEFLRISKTINAGRYADYNLIASALDKTKPIRVAGSYY